MRIENGRRQNNVVWEEKLDGRDSRREGAGGHRRLVPAVAEGSWCVGAREAGKTGQGRPERVGVVGARNWLEVVAVFLC